MSVRLPDEIHRPKTVRNDRTSPTVYVGEPRLRAYIEVVREGTSRAVFAIVGILFVAWAVAAVGLFFGGHRGEAYNLLLSVPGAVLSIVAAGFAYRSARIATRVERSFTPEVSDLERLHAHESESPIMMRALEVFGDSVRAIEWMRESNPALKDEPPIRVIQTEDGRREVLNILGRIQHGVIS
jgi:putative toxin-antitoxin system antitoxin component (TIGR02293 family)